jgi:hypothetical protein
MSQSEWLKSAKNEQAISAFKPPPFAMATGIAASDS